MGSFSLAYAVLCKELGLLRGLEGYQLYDLTHTGSWYLGTVLIYRRSQLGGRHSLIYLPFSPWCFFSFFLFSKSFLTLDSTECYNVRDFENLCHLLVY